MNVRQIYAQLGSGCEAWWKPYQTKTFKQRQASRTPEFVSFKGGGGGGDQKIIPWAGQQPFLLDIYNQAQNTARNVPSSPYTGELTADPNQNVLNAQQDRLNIANASQGLGDGAIDLGQRVLAGDFLNTSSNPYIMDVMDASAGQVYRDLTDQILPRIGSAAQQAGAFGGARQGILEAEAVGNAAREASEVTGQIALENYIRERANQAMAPSLIGSGLDLNLMPSNIAQQVGLEQMGFDQAALDEAFQLDQLRRTQPWEGIGNYSNIVQGNFPAGVVSSGGSGGGGLGGAISGGLGGLMLSSQYGSSLLPAMASTAGAGIPFVPSALGFMSNPIGGMILGGLAGGLL